MASTVVVKLNKQGVRELLLSDGMMDVLYDRAQAIAARAGPGFQTDTAPGKTRGRSLVMTTDQASAKAEWENRALTRAVVPGG